jgi:hypothetical protein
MRWVLLLVPLMVQAAMAQQTAVASARNVELIGPLAAGVLQEAQDAGVAKPQPSSAPVAPPKLTPSAPVTPTMETSSQPLPASGGQGMAGMDPRDTSGFPTMQFRGFSDVSFHADDLKGSASSFALGQFNLFITSKISDRLDVLAEAVVEADEHNSVGIDLERLLFHWASSDYLNVSLGRYHTAIGWYNTAYHHSSWMQTAIGRPFLFEFEDKGGILPVHNVGVSISGKIPSRELGLRYVLEIGNGRASRSRLDEPVQNVLDENSSKAVNLAILSRPGRLPGFQAGLSVYYDTLTPDGKPNIAQTIIAGHAVYQTADVEWLNEVVLLRNATEGADHVSHTTGFYTQVSKKFGPWRPYVRYQYVSVPDDDVLYPDVGLQHGPSAGLRYDVNEFVALKFEYQRTERRRLSSFNGFATQLSFTF